MRFLRILVWLAVALAAFSYSWSAFAQEKVKLTTALKTNPLYFLPAMSAEEKGFWKQEGLDGEWVPFDSSGLMVRAISAGAVSVGIAPATTTTMNLARGVPLIMVADLEGFQRWALWVRAQPPIKGVQDLKGIKVGVARLGALQHAYGQALAQALGLEKDMKFVATGGVPQAVAALKAGAVDGTVLSSISMAILEYEGVARILVPLKEYIPAEQDPLVIFSTRGFLEKSSETLRRMVQAVVRAAAASEADPAWSREKIKMHMRWPDPVVEKVFKLVSFSKDGRIDKKRLQTMRDFLIEYGLAAKDRTPGVAELYVDRFVPVK